MKTIIVWFRNDLRLHDHPALATAARDADQVIPLFVFNDKILHGKHAGSNRNRFLLESLQDLKGSLQKVGADLVLRSGEPVQVLLEIVEQTGAEAIYYSADYTPYAITRDRAVKHALQAADVTVRSFGGRLIVDQIQDMKTKTSNIYKVFTPFWKNWSMLARRPLAEAPVKLRFPKGVDVGKLPKLTDITKAEDLSPHALPGGEMAGRQRMEAWLNSGVNDYHQVSNQMGDDATSRLSSYLHFGCISALELESGLTDNPGSQAFDRQLCWRDFNNYILFHFPTNATLEFQERYRQLEWIDNQEYLQAWQQGKTGYPVVDAAMRQLNTEGWMHNRARLIVGSFLTKDLGLDWRLGESYFMRMLIDGDQANNNGNWQWIAGVGVDPAPVFRRLYNPSLQQKRFDADGSYVHRYVPELAKVSDKYLIEPWTMPQDVQDGAECVVGNTPECNYPAPIVDHASARKASLERYRDAAQSGL